MDEDLIGQQCNGCMFLLNLEKPEEKGRAKILIRFYNSSNWKVILQQLWEAYYDQRAGNGMDNYCKNNFLLLRASFQLVLKGDISTYPGVVSGYNTACNCTFMFLWKAALFDWILCEIQYLFRHLLQMHQPPTHRQLIFILQFMFKYREYMWLNVYKNHFFAPADVHSRGIVLIK